MNVSMEKSFIHWGKKKTRKEVGQLNNEDKVKTEKNLMLSPEVEKFCLKLKVMIETVQRQNGCWKQREGNKNFGEELRCRS